MPRHPSSAAQFMPFAALRGYGELVEQRTQAQQLAAERPDAPDEEALARLRATLAQIPRGTSLRVTHRKGATRQVSCGPLGRLDARSPWVSVGSARLALADITRIELADAAPGGGEPWD